jgi:hypothetical protein
MADPAREQLYREAMEAFRKANEAFERGPKPGTLAWHEWQRLLTEAVAANNAYMQQAELQFANTLPFHQLDSD